MGRGRTVMRATVLAVLLGTLTACGGAGHPPPGTTLDYLAVPEGVDPTAPADGAATTKPRINADRVVGDLWTARQQNMVTELADGFRPIDGGNLLAHDLAVAGLVACGCSKPRDQSPLKSVRVLRPRESSPTTLFAEVLTQPAGHAPKRFVVVARRTEAGWRLVFVTIDRDDEQGAQKLVADPKKRPPATTAADQRAGVAIFRRFAAESQRWLATGRPRSAVWTPSAEVRAKVRPGRKGADRERTSYGANVVTKVEVRAKDPVYVYRLDRKRTIACGAVRSPSRYSSPGMALVQGPDRKGWGAALDPGEYLSITSTVQNMTCILDHGPSARPRYEVTGEYFTKNASVTGKPVGNAS